MTSRNALILAVGALVFATPLMVQAQTPAPDVSPTEMAACRSDAIRLCFFNIVQTDALRACLRRNKPDLSIRCRKLIESRGN
jgi:hypothetical protein